MSLLNSALCRFPLEPSTRPAGCSLCSASQVFQRAWSLVQIVKMHGVAHTVLTGSRGAGSGVSDSIVSLLQAIGIVMSM